MSKTRPAPPATRIDRGIPRSAVDTVRVGRLRRVPPAALQRYVASLSE